MTNVLQIPLRNRSGVVVAHTLIDEEDAPLASLRWHRTVDGYAAHSENRTVVLMHRAIINAPVEMEVDHVNRDRLDNRRENLRLATDAQNHCNYSLSKMNKSGYKGVRHDAGSGWIASIGFANRTFVLGLFATPEEAAIIYDFAALALHRDFAATNFSYSDKVRQEALGMAHLFGAGNCDQIGMQ